MTPLLAGAVAVPAEFRLISRYFKPLADRGALENDGAVLRPPPGRDLVLSADGLVEGVHFLPDDPPETIGRKLLRVNLSDLAAMGAAPLGYLMTVALPRHVDEAWLAGFVAGLARDQTEFAVTLLGGDTTSTPGPACLSATIVGHVAPGEALTRSGAQPGDGIWVTGTIGDGALGLRACRGEIGDASGFLAKRYRLPSPRLGLELAGIASACMDVSDGLVQDLGHLCVASGCAAAIEAALVPLSREAAVAIAGRRARLEECLTGGDDYELLLTVAHGQEGSLREHAARRGVAVTRIGEVTRGNPAVLVLDPSGTPLALDRSGWSHF